MRKIIAITFIICMVILQISKLHSANYGVLTLEIDPSTTSRAMGRVNSVANVWDRNPLLSWSNPAVGAILQLELFMKDFNTVL